MKKRVGIFGGTFNPPHIGHIEAAKAFVKIAELDVLIIMPAFIPPHKEYISSVNCNERLEMCKIAFKNVDKAQVSDLEIARGGKSYTYLTLQELSNDKSELFFLCGTDMILSMDTWKCPEIIFSLANICYIRRESDAKLTELINQKCKLYYEKFEANVIPIDADVIEISSSEIRNGECNLQTFLTDDVLGYIIEKGLYK
jgi:nicotinate-nucleotide adenylyltransferase